MSNRKQIVEDGRAVCNSEQDTWRDHPPASSEIRDRIGRQVEDALAFLGKPSALRSFGEVEKAVVTFVFTLGRLFLNYFLAWRNENSAGEVKQMKTAGSRELSNPSSLIRCSFAKGTWSSGSSGRKICGSMPTGPGNHGGRRSAGNSKPC
jgi:hypothetical protein